MTDDSSPARYPRRLLAALYDLLLIAALWMFTGAVFVWINAGEAVDSGNLVFRLTMLAVAAAFYVSSWHLGGQTPGMKAWRIDVRDSSGRPPGWSASLLRFAAASAGLAVFGVGHLWALFDQEGLCLHDHVTGTRVWHTPKKAH